MAQLGAGISADLPGSPLASSERYRQRRALLLGNLPGAGEDVRSVPALFVGRPPPSAGDSPLRS